jgi:hypothetical protein
MQHAMSLCSALSAAAAAAVGLPITNTRPERDWSHSDMPLHPTSHLLKTSHCETIMPPSSSTHDSLLLHVL